MDPQGGGETQKADKNQADLQLERASPGGQAAAE